MANILYRPRLPNGNYVPLNWAVKIYRWTNLICWPLEDGVPRLIYALDRFYWIFGFMLFVSHIESDFRYLYIYFNDLDEFLTGVPTILVSIEVHLRGFQLGLNKEKLKNSLKRFFNNIYVDQSLDPAKYDQIQRQMRPIFVQSTFYLFTLVSYTIVQPIYILFTGKRELLYKTIPPWEYKEHLYIYLPTLMMNIWIGFIVATMVFGESNILANLVFHLNSRYILMRETFHKKVGDILKSNLNTNAAGRYRRVLIAAIQENLRLNQFAMEIQNEFNFRIFIMFAFSAITLCALIFKVYTSPMTSIIYMFWTVAKIQEIIALGEIGSTITTTTYGVSSMYYESKWESIIERSSNTKDNVQLMRLINLSIIVNSKPFSLRGLHFFKVSLTAVLAILQGAFSYFTCLIALRQTS